jgi:hypothetical protein
MACLLLGEFRWGNLTAEGTTMHDSEKRFLVLLPVLTALALTASACGGSSDSSALPTTPTPSIVTNTFTGSITQNGTAIHPFSVTSSGYTLLAGYTSIAPATVTALGMGIGAWDGTTCGLNQTQNDVARSGGTAISGTAASGNYCIRVYDAGNIPEGVTAVYTLQVQHY